MAEREKIISRRGKAGDILVTSKSADAKLFEIFQLYKDDLKKNYTQFYYAMLEWKDAHLKELLKEANLGVDDNSYFTDNTDWTRILFINKERILLWTKNFIRLY